MLVEQRLSNEKKSVGVAYLLWFFFGGLGVHRFYMGLTGSAIAMLLMTVFGFLLLVVYGLGLLLLIPVMIWLLVDAFRIPGLVERDAKARRAIIAGELGLVSAPATPPAMT
ncbi:TM2 domain-containing protein [Roseovarius sp. SCSIO 43702]|nr:TM2 domain-containing protein [Roseovarius sp. SCSIO 43702]